LPRHASADQEIASNSWPILSKALKPEPYGA
jgi:hypothetical protein